MHTKSCFILDSEYNYFANILTVSEGWVIKQLNAPTEQVSNYVAYLFSGKKSHLFIHCCEYIFARVAWSVLIA